MFITNGKSLFGNTGLIISLLILIVLVYFSYNKCYVNNIDGFGVPTISLPNPEPTSNQSNNTLQAPQNVRIKLSGGSIIVNFTINISNQIPTSFIIVLAQYDINKNNTGNNKFYLSNESVINSNSSAIIRQMSSVQSSNTPIPQTNLCTIVNGVPVCQYVFSNLDIKDSSNNLYYYKLGVSAIYSNGNSLYVTPYNITNSNKMFTLDMSVDNQNINKQSNGTPVSISANTYSDTISSADGQYELIKSQLGNYPDNLLLTSQTTTDTTLSDLVDKSMAQALLNINVSTNTPTIENSL